MALLPRGKNSGLGRAVDSASLALVASMLARERGLGDADANLVYEPSWCFRVIWNSPGRSVFEAGARGIPTVVAMADKVEDIVEDGITGLIVPERDPRALAKAVARLADDGELRIRLGANARNKYLVQFDPERIGRQMLDVYHSVVAENHGKCPELARS